MTFKPTWTHTVCEVCWFDQNPDRFPVMIRRDPADRTVDFCCFCGSLKVTRIYLRESPDSPRLVLCAGRHDEHDDED